MRELKFGTGINSVVDTGADNFDVDTRFRMVREAGVFDYIEKTPPTGEFDIYQRASEKHGIPIRVGGFYYTLGRDEPLLHWHLNIAKALGSKLQNVQIKTLDADGKPVSDKEVAEAYLWAAEIADRVDVSVSFEIHCNMWSEHFGRVTKVGELVERHGVVFNITLDHSHVMFKIDNPREQDVQNMRADIDAGLLELNPFKQNDCCTEWIQRNWIAHTHARAAIPNNPVNIWSKHPDGRFGRGIQYPFMKPETGQYHSEWDETKLEPWKEVLRRLMKFHAERRDSRLGQISTEFLPTTDYGGGATYSIFQNSIACVEWLRNTWIKIQEHPPADVSSPRASPRRPADRPTQAG